MRSHADWAAENVQERIGPELLLYLNSPLLRAGAAGDEVADPATIDPAETVIDCLEEAEARLDLEMMSRNVRSVLQTLPPREAEILEWRYGLRDEHIHTLREVADLFDISTQRIRQLEMRALQRLRHPVRRKRLERFWSPEAT